VGAAARVATRPRAPPLALGAQIGTFAILPFAIFSFLNIIVTRLVLALQQLIFILTSNFICWHLSQRSLFFSEEDEPTHRVMTEIVSSEQTYAAMLRLLVTCFLIPFRRASFLKEFDAAALARRIFGDIESILILHTRESKAV
jgi:hypothetical protein